MLRKLNQNDKEIVSKIIPKRELEGFVSTYLSGLTTWYSYGWLEDGELVGISTAHYSGDQEWFLLKQYTSKCSCLEEMILNVCKEFERKGIYRVFWVDTEQQVDFMKNYIPVYYNHYKEYSILPFGLPKSLKHFNILMNNNPISTNSTVYMSVVPDINRKF
jgi:hypothetical protein